MIEGLRRTIAATVHTPTHFAQAPGDMIGFEPAEAVAHGKDQPQNHRFQASLNQEIVALGVNDTAVEKDEEIQVESTESTSPIRRYHSRLEAVLNTNESSGNKFERAADTVIGICIIANIVFMFCRFEYEGYLAAVQVGLQAPGMWPDLKEVFDVAQHVFCAIFLIELIGRLMKHKMSFFINDRRFQKFNTFDATIVVVTCIDLYFLGLFVHTDSDSPSDFTVIRVLRFARLFRAMRIVRTFEIFSKLRVLSATVTASFFSLLWSLVLLFIAMLMAAMLLTQLLNPYLTDPDLSEDMVTWLFMHYGTSGRSLWTVFEVTFSGGWPAYARPLVEEISTGFAFFFAVYVSSVVFAITKIITALFLKDTMEVAMLDAEIGIHEKMREKKVLAAALLDIFRVADTSDDGKLSWDEFRAFFSDAKVRSYMATLGLDANEVRTLFDMLDDGDGMVTAEEFVQGALRLKGGARSQDIVLLMRDFNKLTGELARVQQSLKLLHTKVDGVVPPHSVMSL